MTAILAAGTAAGARAQQPQQNFLAVGTMAPDISFTGATRYGLLAEPVRVSQFRGQTVVIAFFFRARSPG
jgi:peroxiredoxin